MKIDFKDIRIEIGDTRSNPRYFDVRCGCWVDQRVNYRESQAMDVFGVSVDVMPLADLLDYKRALGRPVDLADVGELTNPS